MNRNNLSIIFLALLVAVAFYLLGKKSGSNNTTVDVANNVAVIKEIAELAALDVQGNTTVNYTNKDNDEGIMAGLKNLFNEKTIYLSIPYDAKYGVDMSAQNVNIDTKEGTATIYLPAIKLLSLQLSLDRVNAFEKTGLFNSLTLEDYLKVSKVLYAEARKSLESNQAHKKLAEEHVKIILEKYYKPLGLKVNCVFGPGSNVNTKRPLQ